MGRTNCIAAWLTGDVIVDCGPATTLDALLEALGDRQPRALLLTHIHFDHAGAAGALVQRWPELEVWVHR
ncbi:MAG: MBL fold metallo-hydrolase, partial [Thermoleophilaceae bacterium]|nr:MBL fold metallo-hydrolase [Thermoleophilaceae bacterium]